MYKFHRTALSFKIKERIKNKKPLISLVGLQPNKNFCISH